MGIVYAFRSFEKGNQAPMAHDRFFSKGDVQGICWTTGLVKELAPVLFCTGANSLNYLSYLRINLEARALPRTIARSAVGLNPPYVISAFQLGTGYRADIRD